MVSAKAIVDRFEDARSDILSDPRLADLWTPILASIGIPFVEAQNVLSYAERMVAQWLDRWMLEHQQMGEQIAKYFSDSGKHGSHGRRIDREHARNVGLVIEDLEDSQELQDAVLRTYHLMTLIFEISHMEKIMRSSHGGGGSSQSFRQVFRTRCLTHPLSNKTSARVARRVLPCSASGF